MSRKNGSDPDEKAKSFRWLGLKGVSKRNTRKRMMYFKFLDNDTKEFDDILGLKPHDR